MLIWPGGSPAHWPICPGGGGAGSQYPGVEQVSPNRSELNKPVSAAPAPFLIPGSFSISCQPARQRVEHRELDHLRCRGRDCRLSQHVYRRAEDDLTRLGRITDLAHGVNLAGIAHILELEHRNTQLESDNARLLSGHTPPTRAAAGPTKHERTAIMTDAEDVPLTGNKPEADVAEQQIPVDLTVDETGLDPTHLTNRSDAEANPADLIDQAISVPLSDDDHPVQY